MVKKETCVQTIVRLTTKRFPSFGNGKVLVDNPLSYALRNKSPMFAAGVDIEEVVRFILAKRNALNRTRRQKIGNDARDISYVSGLLKNLSNHGLNTVKILQPREIRQRLRS